jgi:hypothetical protein
MSDHLCGNFDPLIGERGRVSFTLRGELSAALMPKSGGGIAIGEQKLFASLVNSCLGVQVVTPFGRFIRSG